MKIVNICKAEPYSDDPGEIEGVTIVIDNNLPNSLYRQPLHDASDYYDDQAQLIFDSLRDSLPGGHWTVCLAKCLLIKLRISVCQVGKMAVHSGARSSFI